MNVLSKFDVAIPVAEPPGVAREAAIRFDGVTKTFSGRDDKPAVTAVVDLNLAVARGSILGVIGRSGAGKSTLIRLVNGLERPTRGRVLVEDVAISELPAGSLREARRSIGMIFQHFNLLSSRTVAGNIALPLEVAGARRDVICKRVDELIALVGLTDKRDRYPAELSGGQKQRVGIARALATSPKVLLSDEATSALDPETTRSILALLAEINRKLGITILLITHEMSVVRQLAQEVAVIEDGRIVERGDVFDVFTRPVHPVTRSFLATEAGHALPPYLATRLRAEPQPGGSVVIRVLFRGPFAVEPVVSRLTRDLGADVNLFAGTIDEIAGRPFGSLTIGVPGSLADTALAFLKRHELDTEVLGHVA